MHVHLLEANFGKLRIWRPKEVSYRYAKMTGSRELMHNMNTNEQSPWKVGITTVRNSFYTLPNL